MKKIISFIIFSICLSLIATHTEKLVFSDDFNKLDFKKWKHDLTMSGGGNWEFELYHNNRTNSYVKNGSLYILPTLTSDRIGEANLHSGFRMDMWGGGVADRCTGNNFYGCERTSGAGGNIINPIQSAKLTTSESFRFRYGRVEVKAKLPRGDWLWPAIWMLPADNEYGPWPASGEIDIMESRGNSNYPKEFGGGVESFGSTLHWGTDYFTNQFSKTHQVYTHNNGDLAQDYHTYGLYWDQDRLFTYIDDEKNVVLDVNTKDQSFYTKGNFNPALDNPWRNGGKNAPFDTEYYLVINLAVGGTAEYFPDGVAGKPWSNHSPNCVNEFYNNKGAWYSTWKGEDAALKIDSVKVWSFDDKQEVEVMSKNFIQ
jgi:beta-glucanase (GH16 family)